MKPNVYWKLTSMAVTIEREIAANETRKQRDGNVFMFTDVYNLFESEASQLGLANCLFNVVIK